MFRTSIRCLPTYPLHVLCMYTPYCIYVYTTIWYTWGTPKSHHRLLKQLFKVFRKHKPFFEKWNLPLIYIFYHLICIIDQISFVLIGFYPKGALYFLHRIQKTACRRTRGWCSSTIRNTIPWHLQHCPGCLGGWRYLSWTGSCLQLESWAHWLLQRWTRNEKSLIV